MKRPPIMIEAEPLVRDRDGKVRVTVVTTSGNYFRMFTFVRVCVFTRLLVCTCVRVFSKTCSTKTYVLSRLPPIFTKIPRAFIMLLF